MFQVTHYICENIETSTWLNDNITTNDNTKLATHETIHRSLKRHQQEYDLDL